MGRISLIRSFVFSFALEFSAGARFRAWKTTNPRPKEGQDGERKPSEVQGRKEARTRREKAKLGWGDEMFQN